MVQQTLHESNSIISIIVEQANRSLIVLENGKIKLKSLD